MIPPTISPAAPKTLSTVEQGIERPVPWNDPETLHGSFLLTVELSRDRNHQTATPPSKTTARITIVSSSMLLAPGVDGGGLVNVPNDARPRNVVVERYGIHPRSNVFDGDGNDQTALNVRPNVLRCVE